jgi:V/A-type H+-transporting ATPase subunit D
MSAMRVNPNRMELMKLRRRRDVARRGHKLLKDKLDELMKAFMARIGEVRMLRAAAEEQLRGVYGLFAVARGEAGSAELTQALLAGDPVPLVESRERNVMSVRVPEMDVREIPTKAIELLAAEIERTRRRVNALEHVLIPQISATVRDIQMKLDEAERGNLTRLMKVKEMVAEKSSEGGL